MNHISITLSVILLVSAECHTTCAQEIPRPEAITFIGTEGAARQLKKAVFAVQMQGNLQNADKGDDWVIVGTGFFVQGSNSVLLGVTCKHVVSAVKSTGRDIFIGMDTESGYQRLASMITYIDPSNDIAILAPQHRADEDLKPTIASFPSTMFDDGSSLIEGRGVMMPGYPLALGVEDDKNHPVIRIGLIAQFTGKDYFLIDGVASHGNSGSPVFTVTAKDQQLVGMLTAHVTDRITLLDENGQMSAQLPYNSGLARAITMNQIQKAIESAHGKY